MGIKKQFNCEGTTTVLKIEGKDPVDLFGFNRLEITVKGAGTTLDDVVKYLQDNLPSIDDRNIFIYKTELPWGG